MPEIVFKGKEYVYNHHLTVPYRPLVADAAKGIGPGDLNGSLVIHGDNLHALKALLPRYAGRVDLVFIDPPYNTGNEGWCYSDGVNSPIMKEWLTTNPVDTEDMLRHDKWLCMMWPRLVMLRELMSDSGSIWITLDDNEVHRARMVLDEIFGAENHAGTIVWANKVSPTNDAQTFSEDHDYVLVYARNLADWMPNKLERTNEQEELYGNPDEDTRGPWNSLTYTSNKSASERPNLNYAIIHPKTGAEVWPQDGTTWRFTQERHQENVSNNLLYWGVNGDARQPRFKRFLADMGGVVPRSVWGYDRFGSTQRASLEMQELGLRFPTPKPLNLLEAIVAIGASNDGVILDSFAGSGTTAHAVLKANAKDKGSRKFILVEGEDYADRLTAERVRRAINGYAWQGTQRETLLEEKINFTQFKKADQWLAKVEAIKAAEGFGADDAAQMALGEAAAPPAASAPARKKRFDKINVELKDGVLRVEGEKRVSQMADGLGGEFTYCTLGEPLSVEKLLSGQDLPHFEALGAWLLHTATGGTLQA
ncbi:MAG TPA: site-specific DNA-methyltransferase, partial [Acidovorax temperans]|nr:site-specific DNA-methyltransferase [Acidovorax temperans]